MSSTWKNQFNIYQRFSGDCGLTIEERLADDAPRWCNIYKRFRIGREVIYVNSVEQWLECSRAEHDFLIEKQRRDGKYFGNRYLRHVKENTKAKRRQAERKELHNLMKDPEFENSTIDDVATYQLGFWIWYR